MYMSQKGKHVKLTLNNLYDSVPVVYNTDYRVVSHLPLRSGTP